MEMFVAYNSRNIPSKKDGKLYKFISKEGVPIAFEKNSKFWKMFSKYGVEKISDDVQVYYFINNWSFFINNWSFLSEVEEKNK